MNLQERLEACEYVEASGPSRVEIKFNRLEPHFDDKNRVLNLYSNVSYSCEDFHWDAELPTVRIPYKDPSFGFMLEGKVFSSIGVYQRAPGVVMRMTERNVKSVTVQEPRVDIISARSSTISIGSRLGGIHISFSKNKKTHHVPIGMFLKAISGLPYSVILERIAYKPQELLNGFPLSKPEGNARLDRRPCFDVYDPIANITEPSIEECVDMVASAIGSQDSRFSKSNFSVQWKMTRINHYLNNLEFKTVQNYETRMSMASRAISTKLKEGVCVPIYIDDGNGMYSEGTYTIAEGTTISAELADELRKYDVQQLRVSKNRSFILHEDTPVLFRVKGYKIAQEIPQIIPVLREQGILVDCTTDLLINDIVLDALNNSDLTYLEVFTPNGRKTVSRARKAVALGDFITIINQLLTTFMATDEVATEFEIENRIIRDYVNQVAMEVMRTYGDIAEAISGATKLEHVFAAMPALPSTRLCDELRNSDNKEITQADMTNIMSIAISSRKSSALMDSASAGMMHVQKGQYGRLDALHSPDSDKVGSIQHMTFQSRLNPRTGEVETPYEEVRDGRLTGEIVWLNAAQEANKYIAAWNEDFSSPTVVARYNDAVTTVNATGVHYRDASPFCDMSVSRMCIPFPGFSQSKRAVMATKMNGQAVPLLKPERPYVSTGAETEVPSLYFTARQILEYSGVEPQSGVLLELLDSNWGKTLVTYNFLYGDTKLSFSAPYTRTDKETLYNYNVNRNTKKLKHYEIDDIVLYNQSCDMSEYEYWARTADCSLPLVKDFKRPAVALGVNLRMCYKTSGTSTIEDGVLISDRLVTDKTLSSIQIIRYELQLKAGESFSATGNARLHSHVHTGEPVITVVRTKRDRMKERSLLADQAGEVVYSNLDEVAKTAEVWVATLHNAEVGDKVAGRYGNKSVIAKIIPEWMMPYDPEDGRPMDIVCSPLGLPSRMNLGQILECAIGAVVADRNSVAVCTPFYPGIKDEIINEYEGAGMKPKRLFNPEYGKLTERPVMTGILYFMKLEQMSNRKYAAVGEPIATDAVFGTPIKSMNRPKGQAVGEQETWTLYATGAKRILNNLFTLYSGDEKNREAYFRLLNGNKDTEENPWDEYEGSYDGVDGITPPNGDNINALVMQTVARMFGLDVDHTDTRYSFVPLRMKDITRRFENLRSFSDANLTFAETEWCRVKLLAPVVNPFWIENFPLGAMLGTSNVKSLVAGKYFISRNYLAAGRTLYPEKDLIAAGADMSLYMTGMDALISLIRNTTLEDAENFILDRLEAGGVDTTDYSTEDVSEDEDDESPDMDSVQDAVFRPVNDEDTEEADEDSADDDGEDSGYVDNDDGEVPDDDVLEETKITVPMYLSDLLKFVRRMKSDGMTLNDLVWTDLPVLPRVFRQSNVVGSREQDHSFFKYIKRILGYSTSQEVYKGLREFIGYGSENREDLQTLRGYFFGKGAGSEHHGAVRGNVLSKRVGFSGRTVITPAQDMYMSPFFVAVPWVIALAQLSSVLAIRMKKREVKLANYMETQIHVPVGTVENLELTDWVPIIESLYEFNPYVLGQYFNFDTPTLYAIYNYLRSVLKGIIEGDVTNDGFVKYKGEYVDPTTLPEDATIDAAIVVFGRQPTLHKKSMRTFFVKLVDGYCQQIHPVMCKGYNADFDGDTMYTIQLLGSMKVESCKTLSVLQDLISEKDGSYTLDLAQDVALGIYCASVFRNNEQTFTANEGDYLYFDNVGELRAQVEYGDVPYHKAVLYRHSNGHYYCSTAGRIMLNAAVPGCFTEEAFVDTHGIVKAVLGESFPVDQLRALRHDTVWVSTGARPAGRKDAVEVSPLLLNTYDVYGARESVMTTQRLYELGIVASDLYSISVCLDDMSVDTSNGKGGDVLEDCMVEPRETVNKLNSLYRMGLIDEEQRKSDSVRAWNEARQKAQEIVLGKLDPSSNTFMMMYSGARGNAAQVMQTVGFVGTLTKNASEDIEYPVLRGYGNGLTSLDQSQTRHAARMGVISTQDGTKQTGYSTRQSVYMTAGLNISGTSCACHMPKGDPRAARGSRIYTKQVVYSDGESMFVAESGKKYLFEELNGDIFLSGAQRGSELARVLGRKNFIVDEEVIELLRQENDIVLEFATAGKGRIDRPSGIDANWRAHAIANYKSYALPFTEDFRLTEKTIDWIDEVGLTEIAAWDLNEERAARAGGVDIFHLEAYLPVDYDTSKYTLRTNGKEHKDNAMFYIPVSPDSEGYIYYKNLLDEGRLTSVALKYLTKKKVRSVTFEDGTVTYITYELSKMFKDLVMGRYSEGLPALQDQHYITSDTLKIVEKLQLQYIPVYTGVTCLSPDGICQRCYGLASHTRKLLPDGTNLGVAASEAMCEPLSQATLNVANNAGKRAGGVGQLSGLNYYKKLLSGRMVTSSKKHQLEQFAAESGFIKQSPHDKKFVNLVHDDGKSQDTFVLDDEARLNVPDGAYVNRGDTVVSGFPDLSRHDGNYIYGAALKTRIMLIQEYYKIFSELKVSVRNVEVLARAQTSNCYATLESAARTDKIHDTAVESVRNSYDYLLRVSLQAETVLRYTGVAAFAFESVGTMLSASVMQPEGVALTSFLGNLATGTEVGSKEAKFIDRVGKPVRESSRVETAKQDDFRERSVSGLGNQSARNYSLDDGPGYFAMTTEAAALLAGSEEQKRAAMMGAASVRPVLEAPAEAPSLHQLLDKIPDPVGTDMFGSNTSESVGMSSMNLQGTSPAAPAENDTPNYDIISPAEDEDEPESYSDDNRVILSAPSDEEEGADSTGQPSNPADSRTHSSVSKLDLR